MVILLCGLPGTGKTTFAAALVRRLGRHRTVHLESDRVRKACFARPRYTTAESRTVFDCIEREAAAAAGRGLIVIVDATNVSAIDRRRFETLTGNGRCVVVRLTAPERTIRERLSRPREGYSDASMAVHSRMARRQEPIAPPHVVVDTRYDTASTLALVVALVEAAP